MRYRINDDGVVEQIEPSPPGVPDIIHAFLPQDATQAKVKAWSGINHTQAGTNKTFWQNLKRWWERPEAGGTEAHVITELDGLLVQLMRLTRRADCNFKANGWYETDVGYVGAVSIEHQDNGWGPGNPNGAQDWPPPQFETTCQFWAAVCVWAKIPVQDVLPDWNDRGISYHSRHEEWSKFVGKSCPGWARIDQMDAMRMRISQIIDNTYLPPTPLPTPGGDDMSTYNLVHRMNEQLGTPDFTAFSWSSGTLSHQVNGLVPFVENRGDVILVDLNNAAAEFNAMFGTAFHADHLLHAIIESSQTVTQMPHCVGRNGGLRSSWVDHATNAAASRDR
jgi:hypothetical protein